MRTETEYSILWMDYSTFRELPIHWIKPDEIEEHDCFYSDYLKFDFNALVRLTPRDKRIYVLNHGNHHRLIILPNIEMNEVEGQMLAAEIEENLEFMLHGEL